MLPEGTVDSTLATTMNILDEYERGEAERRLPPDGTWPGVLYSWEKRTSADMPDWHKLRHHSVYNLRFTITADRDFTVFAEATTDVVKKENGRLHMACILAAQIFKLAGVTKEALQAATNKDDLFEQALDQAKVSPLKIRGARSKDTDTVPSNGKPRGKQRFWINEITKG